MNEDTSVCVPDILPGMKVSLELFVQHCIEMPFGPTVYSFISEEFKVEWSRQTYSDDREGLSYFTVSIEGCEVSEETMFGDVDNDALMRIADFYEPGMEPGEIEGIVK